jgi:hypothetical protein
MGFHLHLLLRANTRKYSTINHLQFTYRFMDSDRLAAARDGCDLQVRARRLKSPLQRMNSVSMIVSVALISWR